MSLRGLLTKEGREARTLAKNIKKANDKHAQHEDRFRALDKLREDGSDEAIYGMLSRFSFVYDKTINDEAEKEFVFDSLCALPPEQALPPLQRYLRNAASISWPLRILQKVTDRDGCLAVLRDLFERNPPGYVRDPSKKIQLIHFVGDEGERRLGAVLAPYLGDIDEGVRFATVDALVKLRDEASTRLPLLEALVRPEEESLRLRRRIIDGLAELGWSVEEHAEALKPHLPEGAWLEGGKIRRKT